MKILCPLLMLCASLSALAQGPLTPPSTAGDQIGPIPALNGGAPQPMMKTLYQAEPRVPVQTLALLPPYTISVPGSYYLTDNITVATGDAIVIAASNVTLDLNGFSIRSTLTGSSLGAGVSLSAGVNGVSVRNGSIIGSTTVPTSGAPVQGGFKYGISGATNQASVSCVHVVGVGNYAISILGTVERCTVESCGFGIQATQIRDCSAVNCYGAAIYAETAFDSQGQAVTEIGLEASSAFNCSGTSRDSFGLSGRTSMNCTGTSTSSIGLEAISATNCTGTSTTGIGLRATMASNCIGTTSGTTSSAIGLWCLATANACRGENTVGSVAISLKAEIAVGCTFSGTTPVVPAGKSFNM